MTKKYRIARIKTKEKSIPCGYDNTTECKYSFVSDYWFDYDTIEEAEVAISEKIKGREEWTIISVYTEDD